MEGARGTCFRLLLWSSRVRLLLWSSLQLPILTLDLDVRALQPPSVLAPFGSHRSALQVSDCRRTLEQTNWPLPYEVDQLVYEAKA